MCTSIVINRKKHDWMGWDRYNKAEEMIKNATEDFDVNDCFYNPCLYGRFFVHTIFTNY